MERGLLTEAIDIECRLAEPLSNQQDENASAESLSVIEEYQMLVNCEEGKYKLLFHYIIMWLLAKKTISHNNEVHTLQFISIWALSIT